MRYRGRRAVARGAHRLLEGAAEHFAGSPVMNRSVVRRFSTPVDIRSAVPSGSVCGRSPA